MRIVIDMQGAQASNAKRGIGRYTLALVQAMLENNNDEDQFILLCNAFFPESISEIKEIFSPYLSKKSIKVWTPIAEDDQRSQKVYEAYLMSLNPQLIMISSLFEGSNDEAITSIKLLNKNIPVAVIQYDLIPLVHEQIYLNNPQMKKWYFEKLEYLKKADLVLSISTASKDEAIKYLNLSSIVNISAASQSHFKAMEIAPPQKKELFNTYKITKPFIMYTGGIDYRKNVEGLIRAYALLPQDLIQEFQLLIVCAITQVQLEQLLSLIKANGLDERDVIFTNYISENDLVSLYNLCKVFVFPSLHEGFGFPVLEAMQCHKAVICGNNSSLIEVMGLEEAMFDAKDDKSIAAKIQHVLRDEEFCKSLENHAKEQSQKFSWQSSAKIAIQEMKKLQVKLSPINKAKLAYISPLPPEKSGISDYSAELLLVLSKHYDIDVIVKQTQVTDTWIIKNCKIIQEEEFKQHHSHYQRVLYHFGNSSFHDHMFDLLDKIPGIVVLHDFYISSLIFNLESTGKKEYLFTQSLYHDHGLYALNDHFKTQDVDAMISKYPLNLRVLQNALGIITHSQFSIDLIKHWYNEDLKKDHFVIPHLRQAAKKIDKLAAKEELSLAKDSFVICSFGLIGDKKLHHRLLEAFLESSLCSISECHLIFVGENPATPYGAELTNTINNSNSKNKIIITSWVDTNTFHTYLQAADIAVQLRTSSRGETSGAVLDCMNYALPTIVNANGSMAELSKQALHMLEDDFTNTQLVSALEKLYEDEEYRTTLSQNAQNIIQTKHEPVACAKQYNQAIESIYNKPSNLALANLINSLKEDTSRLSDSSIKNISQSLAYNFTPQPKMKQLFVDISELVQRDSKTGIQRVVKNILNELLKNPPKHYKIEPIYADEISQGYRYAHQFVSKFLDIPQNVLFDKAIDFYEDDIFLGVDLNLTIIPFQEDYLQFISQKGVKVIIVVHDLLPILQADTFLPLATKYYLPWIKTIAKFHSLIAISKSVKEELHSYLPNKKNISYFHLGAGITKLDTPSNLSKEQKSQLQRFKKSKTFLMIGTIEPRKAHAQTLESFELLWKKNIDISLVIVGKKGWLVESFLQKVQNHPQLNQRLFILQNVDNTYLQELYLVSDCLIAASYGEGFGLPLIEAAQHKLAIIARDIPVFKEVASKYAYYYEDTRSPIPLAETLKQWLDLYKQDLHPKSIEMPYLTWEQSTQKLLQNILKDS